MQSLARLNAADDAAFVAALGGIYEHSEWVARAIAPQRPFASLAELRTAMQQTVDGASGDEKIELIRAHPDLAGKLARAGKLTPESAREQAGLGLDRLSDPEFESFSQRNEAYRKRFGFPFVICARLTDKAGISRAFDERISHDPDEEIEEAIRQIHLIAGLRLNDLVTPK